MKKTILLGLILIFSLFLFGCADDYGEQGDLWLESEAELVKSEFACPELSDMELEGYDNLFQSWTTKVSPYKSGNAEIIYTYTTQMDEQRNIIYCDAGSDEGQNANWVYCGDALRPIVVQYTDNYGTIIKKRSIQVTFDKNTKEYLATECDVYGLW